MRNLSFVIPCLLSFQLLNAQVRADELSQKTSEVLQQLTEQWKSDSLGLQRYRINYFKALSKSRPDSISKAQLLKHLGRPNLIQKSVYGKPFRTHVEYVYFMLHDDPGGKILPFVGRELAEFF